MAYSVSLPRASRALSGVFLALAAACGSAATDGIPSGYASLAVSPEYPASFSPGALNLVIDQVRLRVVRPPSEWLVDTSAAFPAGAGSVMIRVQMPLKARQERLDVVLELYAGPLLVFAGSRTLDVAEGLPSGPPPTIPLTYRGPGAEARVIRITPRDTVLQPGGGLVFGIFAENGSGVPVGDVYVNWSLGENGGGAAITPSGLLTAPAARGSVMLRALAATGARDSTRIWFAPPPATFVPTAGAGQAGTVGTGLAAPLVARVLAADGLGVPGIPVHFASPAPGASVSNPIVITDGDGYARTQATLGTRAGAQGFSGFVSGLGGVQFTVTALVGPAAVIHLVRGGDQVVAPGVQLPVPLEISVRDQYGNPVRDALVRWEVVQGGGELGLLETLTDQAGVALSAYTMGPAPVTNYVKATLVSTGTSVVFVLRSP